MMDHDQYRRALLADPRSEEAELAAHRAGCAECRAFTERLLRFESRVERALKINVAGEVLPFKRPRAATGRPRRFALAASVAAAVVMAGVVWLAVPHASLAADVVAHMAGELPAWDTRDPVPDAELAAVLRDAKMKLMPKAGEVSYASSCAFRGHRVPHLVVQSAHGPVTVMVLVHEPVRKAEDFDEQGYRGTIVPVAGHGSVAVLMRDTRIPPGVVEAIAAQVRDAIVWSP
jgi:hypothetical protein